MISAKYIIFYVVFLPVVAGCGLVHDSETTTSPPQAACTAATFMPSSFPNSGSFSSNALAVTVNGSSCGGNSAQYPNEPCVSVTICAPTDPTNCQTIDNILLDTGSFGLRIFSSAITVPLVPVTSGGSQLAECVQFGDGSSEWGPVQYAYVQLAGEPKVAVPIHTVNYNYGNAPAPCGPDQSFPDSGPADTGFNGILGVGLFAQDCGPDCAADADNGQYYTCTGADCSCGAVVPTAVQVTSPSATLPTDNNGVVLTLPAVAAAGAASLSGTLLLGVGTQANNSPGSVTTFSANGSAQFSTQFTNFSSSFIPGFIDSGSSVLFFPSPVDSSLPDCGGNLAGFFCPTSSVSFTATNQAASGGVAGSTGFSIANGSTLLASANMVFGNLGVSTGSSQYFDWGLPFFYGKSVIVGIDGTSSSLGAGPYWAY